jgi:hypothetical protein
MRTKEPSCRVCECTEVDCFDCVGATGIACWWVEPALCSACVVVEAARAIHRLKGPLWARDLAELVGVNIDTLNKTLRVYEGWHYFDRSHVEIYDLTDKGRRILLATRPPGSGSELM